MKVTKFDIFLLVLAGADFGQSIHFFTEGRWVLGGGLTLSGLLLVGLILLSAKLEK